MDDNSKPKNGKVRKLFAGAKQLKNKALADQEKFRQDAEVEAVRRGQEAAAKRFVESCEGFLFSNMEEVSQEFYNQAHEVLYDVYDVLNGVRLAAHTIMRQHVAEQKETRADTPAATVEMQKDLDRVVTGYEEALERAEMVIRAERVKLEGTQQIAIALFETATKLVNGAIKNAEAINGDTCLAFHLEDIAAIKKVTGLADVYKDHCEQLNNQYVEKDGNDKEEEEQAPRGTDSEG